MDKGHDMGESSALELYAILKKASSEGGGKFVAMICDGIEKYKKNLASIGQEGPTQVSVQEANASGYDKVIWRCKKSFWAGSYFAYDNFSIVMIY